jgi:hypothetical protein
MPGIIPYDLRETPREMWYNMFMATTTVETNTDTRDTEILVTPIVEANFLILNILNLKEAIDAIN